MSMTDHTPSGPSLDEISQISSDTSFIREQSKYLSIIHINAQSLRNKMDQLIIESEQADILAITETWLHPEIANECLSIPDFHEPLRKDRDENAYGGVAIYCRETHTIKERKDLEVQGLEALWVEITTRGKKMLIGCIYRPPNATVDVWDRLSESVENAKNSGIDMIHLLGDLNCDQQVPGNRLEMLLSHYHMTQLIHEPTHITETSQTTLDIIATSALDMVKLTEVMPPSLSNHCNVGLLLKMHKIQETTYKRRVLNYNRADWEKLNKKIEEFDWEPTLAMGNTDLQVNSWTQNFNMMINECIPTKTVHIKNNEPPWFTSKAKNLKKEKLKMHKKAKKQNTGEVWAKFRRKRNEYLQEIVNAKRAYWEKQSEEIKSNMERNDKEWWKLTRYIYCKNKNISAFKPPLIVNNKETTSNDEKAEAFNAFFCTMSTIDTSGAPPLPEINTSEQDLTKITVTALDVQDVLQALNPKKACGDDGISPRILRETARTISKPLSRIYNFSLATSTVPQAWKNANVTPIHKKGDKQSVSNYRPISLLSTPGKCLERCVHKVVYNYLLDRGKISKNQSAFRENNSTTTQLLELYHHIVSSLDQGKEIRFIFLDVSKAFDRVWHEGLLHKLKEAGISGKLLNWFQSYLTNRKQRVVIEGAASILKELLAGVPQGSILGPLLFILYVNELAELENLEIRLYADDATLYVTYDDAQTAATHLINSLEQVQRWATSWFVKFNPTKSESLTITRKRQPQILDVMLNNTTVTNVESHKHLGLTLQKDGKWTEHIREITSRASRRVDILRGYMYKLDRGSLERLYLTYIRPILEYADIVWDNCSGTESDKLEDIQRAAARVVCGAKRGTSHARLYEEVQWEKLKDRRAKHKLSMMHKLSKNKAPETLLSLLPARVEQRQTYRLRNNDNITMPTTSTALLQKSFYPSTINAWNALSPEDRNVPSTEAFKEHLKFEKELRPHYLTGERTVQIHHARLRLACSDLKQHLFQSGLTDDPTCQCRAAHESPAHYLLECNLYEVERDNLFLELEHQHLINVETLLFGAQDLDAETNIKIFKSVQRFIIATKRLFH